MLAQTNATADTIVEVHTKDLKTQKAYAATVNLAGRQRMLTQKAAKEMCFISLDIEVDKMRVALANTLELFETSLYALENGDFDMSIIDPPNLAALIKISEIRTTWEAFRTKVDVTLSGAGPSDEDMIFVETANKSLFTLSNELVALYFK